MLSAVYRWTEGGLVSKKAMRAVGMEDGVAVRDGGEEEVMEMEEEASMLAV